LHRGYEAACMENICFVPADGQFDINELIPFKNVSENSFVSFFRLENTVYSIYRNFLSLLNKKLNQWILGVSIKDVNWVKIYKKKQLDSIVKRVKSSLVETEICAKLMSKGYNIIEIQSKYLARKTGKSKGASFKITIQAVMDIIKLIWSIYLFKLTGK
jgi:dolichol-phosphate mannosyltransferase